jgi:hypothetical protein
MSSRAIMPGVFSSSRTSSFEPRIILFAKPITAVPVAMPTRACSCTFVRGTSAATASAIASRCAPHARHRPPALVGSRNRPGSYRRGPWPHMSLEALDQRADAHLVRVHHFAQVPPDRGGWRARSKRPDRRTGEGAAVLDRHDVSAPPTSGACHRIAGTLERRSQIGHHLEQPLTVAKRSREFLQVVVAELRQDVEANVVSFERPRVLSQTVPFELPGDPDLVRCAPCGNHARHRIHIELYAFIAVPRCLRCEVRHTCATSAGPLKAGTTFGAASNRRPRRSVEEFTATV